MSHASTPEEPQSPENPLDQQRELMELLSQETRHNIIQVVLGHPHHLVSEDELNYYIPEKSKKAIIDQAGVLTDAGILAHYDYPENRDTRGLPRKFYGFTKDSIDVLGSFNYLKGVPFVRAVHEKTHTTKKIERHEQAPRPDLPKLVEDALSFDEVPKDSKKESR